MPATRGPGTLRLFIGFLAVILIWSTTPLAIKWSGEGPGFIFGVSARMVIGMLMLIGLAIIKRVPIPFHRQAFLTYLAAGFGIYGAMLSVYWGAQYIQSGFISVLFGLTPILTGILAYFILNERGLTLLKLLGVIFAITGLGVIFSQSIDFGHAAGYGIIGVLTAVVLHSLSAVFVKRLHGDLSSLTVTTGGMLLATPSYIMTWLLLDGEIPKMVPLHALWSIIYLGVIATAIGFNLYFYILKHLQASQVALLTLVTPVIALWIGQLFNNEHIGFHAWFGSAMILLGMAVYQWSHLLPSVWLKGRK
ncbi:MAG: DMT family transporter [Thioalkalispiraceae bacterium]|jgi:drug/metabolite transporter (DMT)-like permease